MRPHLNLPVYVLINIIQEEGIEDRERERERNGEGEESCMVKILHGLFGELFSGR